MKAIHFIFAVCISLLTVNCSGPQSEKSAEIKADKHLALKVEGMVCAVGCAKYIEKEVAKLEGVTNCTVNFEDGTASIFYSGKMLGEDEIVRSINELNEGQYKVEVESVTSESDIDVREVDGDKKNVEDKVRVSFHFPELKTYFMSRLVR